MLSRRLLGGAEVNQTDGETAATINACFKKRKTFAPGYNDFLYFNICNRNFNYMYKRNKLKTKNELAVMRKLYIPLRFYSETTLIFQTRVKDITMSKYVFFAFVFLFVTST